MFPARDGLEGVSSKSITAGLDYQKGPGMNLEFGKSIITSDGAKAGTADQFVLDPKTRDFVAIISKEGFLFSEERIIEESHIDHIDDDGTIHLKVTEAQVNDLPTVASTRFVHPESDDDFPYEGLDRDTFMGATGAGYLFVGATGSYAPIAPAPSSIFEPADADPAPMEDVSNVPEWDVVISEGTDVVDSGGKKIGEVEEIEFGDDDVRAIVVKAGFLFHHRIRVPAEWISSVTHDNVQLNRVADEVEHEGRID